MRVRLTWLLPFVALACGEPQPVEDPLAYLRVGVDPAAETAAVVEGLVEHGFALVHRIDGDGFAAVALARSDPPATAVRVVTSRGIALAIDTPHRGAPGVRGVGLLADPSARAADLDGDGRPELVVTVEDELRERTCLVLLRVREDGGVQELVVADEEMGGLDEAPCVERLTDVDGDGSLEALLVVRLQALARDRLPAIEVPFVARRGVWTRGTGVNQPEYYEAARGALQAELLRARRELDIDVTYRIAVELAALARAAGQGTSGQVEAFDGALSGLVLTAEQASFVARARSFIAAGFRDPPVADAP